MYREAYGWFERSEGVLDFAAGPVFDAWGFGFKSGEMPSDEEVARIRTSCGMRLLKPEMVPDENGMLSVRDLRLDGTDAPVVLNYNAIAQGYSCDLVAAYLYSIGVKDMLVDIGEIWCDGFNPGRRPWSVGVDRPFDRPDAGSSPLVIIASIMSVTDANTPIPSTPEADIPCSITSSAPRSYARTVRRMRTPWLPGAWSSVWRRRRHS